MDYKKADIENLDYETLFQVEAVYGICFAIIAADGNVTDAELKQLRKPINEYVEINFTKTELPEFENELNKIHDKVVTAYKLVGSEAIMERYIPIINKNRRAIKETTGGTK
jgi:uncharacterized tellurite resistance protein B-like protein